MDVALGHGMWESLIEWIRVLILVVMDVALGLSLWNAYISLSESLNPCCNGCRTWAYHHPTLEFLCICLNPCCNGCRTWASKLTMPRLRTGLS